MINLYRTTKQISELSFEDIKNVVHEIQTKGAAVFYNQQIDQAEFVRFMKTIGECEAPMEFMNSKDYPEIFLVTAKKDEDGNKVGMFGEGELGWHSNGNSRHNVDKILIGLYCVKSDPNATLSICQTSQPFYDLSREEQEYWKTIKIQLKFQNHTMYSLDDNDPELEFMSRSRGSIRKLVDRHPITGEYYFYFPYFFIVKAWQGHQVIDHAEMIEKLKPIIFKSQYQHHIIFQEKDLVLMDQFTTLHRRTPVAKDRLMWRIAADYTKIMPAEFQSESSAINKKVEPSIDS